MCYPPVDPAPCMDCGVNTTPCNGNPSDQHAGQWEWYMVRDQVWAHATGSRDTSGYLCIGCLEKRLGRRIHGGDLNRFPISLPAICDSPRLAAVKNSPGLRKRSRRPAGRR